MFPDGLAPNPADASVVKEEVNGLPVEFRGRRLDARGVGDIQRHDSEFVVARFSQMLQLGSRTWMTTSRVDLPTICQVLPGEF